MTIALLAVFAVQAAAATRGVVGTPAPSLPPYIRIVADGKEVTPSFTPDSVFYRIAGHAIFIVNRTQLRANDPFVRELTDSVIPMVNRAGWALVAIDLRGAASPEGPYWNNVRLSKGRAKAMHDYLTERLDSVNVNDISISTIPEDYLYLLWLLERDGDSAAPLLRRIIDKYGIDHPADIKRELRALYGGRYWTRLLRDYFPKLRSARIVLYFERITPQLRQPDFADISIIEPKPLEMPAMPSLTDIALALRPRIVERPHMLSLGTNLLYDGFYMPQYGWAPMPNVNVEFFPRHGNFTYRFQFLFPYYHRWSKHKFFQIRDYHFEVRRYFNPGKLHTGAYLGAYVNNNKFGIGVSDTKGWQGEGLGGALKLGYVVPLGSGRWRVDFHVAAGYYVTRYDPYVYGNPVNGDIDGDYYYDWVGSSSAFRRRNHQFSWFGPTEVGVTVSYDVLFWRKAKKGVSVLRNEIVWP